VGEGIFRRALRRLGESEEQAESDALQQRVAEVGATSVSQCPLRERADIFGTVESVGIAPRAGAPSLEAELYDGSDTLLVVWLGRRRIAGIHPGINLLVRGRVGLINGQKVIFNPDYELLPS
jgi:hypothetical protein